MLEHFSLFMYFYCQAIGKQIYYCRRSIGKLLLLGEIKMKKYILIVISMFLLVGCSSTTQTIEQRNTPEKVMQLFISNINSSDSEKLKSLSIADGKARFIEQVIMLIASFSAEEYSQNLSDSEMNDLSNRIKDGDIEYFLEHFKGELKVVRIDTPMAEKINSQPSIDSLMKIAKSFNADEMTERIALIKENGGKHYLVGLQLVRYGEEWSILRLGSNLCSIPSTGVFGEISETEYLNLL